MGIFDFFSNNGPSVAEEWHFPESEQDIDKLFQNDSGIQIIYKHSFTCGISMMSKNRIEPTVSQLAEQATFHFVDVKSSRPLSNYIAQKSGLRHESPQLIILYNGEVFDHGSHGQVTDGIIREAVEELTGK